MKKRLICTIVSVMTAAALTACSDGSASSHNVTATQSMAQVIQNEMDKVDSARDDNGNSGEFDEALEDYVGSDDVSDQAEESSIDGADYNFSQTTGDDGSTENGDAKNEEDGSGTSVSENDGNGGTEGDTADASESSEDEYSAPIDVDLSAMNSILVYTEVYNMVSRPDDYVGKVVKMTGSYSYYYDQSTDTEYHACIIQDATACCAQGIEFEPETAVYPDDFPSVGQDVTVIGVFDYYFEADMAFMTLRDAVIV